VEAPQEKSGARRGSEASFHPAVPVKSLYLIDIASPELGTVFPKTINAPLESAEAVISIPGGEGMVVDVSHS
jgi:hypothetical protein